MTTAVAFVAHGAPVSGLRAQPFGALLAVAAAVAFWGALHIVISGSMLGRAVSGLVGGRAMALVGGAFALAWIYKLATWP